MQTSKYGTPSNDEATNRVMSDLALSSAIEIELLSKGLRNTLPSLRELASILDKNKIDDLTMVTVYDRALASDGNTIQSKQDMHDRLFEISKKMNNADQEEMYDLNILKEFCLSLHEALLNSRIDTIYKSSSIR